MMKKSLAMLLTVCVMLISLTTVLAAEGTPAESPSDVTGLTVTFDANEGTGTMATLTADANGKVTIPKNTFTKDLFDFTGWNTVADGAGEAYKEGDVITLTESITLYAQWQKKGAIVVECTVTYDANGGEGETIDMFSPYIQNGIAFVVDNEFTRDGYTFKEWNTKADGTGTSYAEGDTFDITENVVLYAIWESDGSLSDDPVIEDPDDNQGQKPVVPEVPEDDVTNSNVDDSNPKTGDTVATAVALTAGIVALGAFVVLKKKED